MSKGEIKIFQSGEGKTEIQVRLENETVWLSQKQISQIFGVDRTVVTKHLQNVLRSGELVENSVCAFFAHTAEDGKTYETKFYNLDMIISVGYRVNFLAKNNILFDSEGNKKINDRALVAITLLIAESHPKDKELMTNLVLNLIN